MTVPWVPVQPDLIGPWRLLLLDALPGVDVGWRRPASVQNLSRPFLRLHCLGGPWRQVALWYPLLATEAWCLDAFEAHRIDSIAARVTAQLEGFHGDGFTITSSELVSQGADSDSDGSPVVLTQAALCVQVSLSKGIANG